MSEKENCFISFVSEKLKEMGKFNIKIENIRFRDNGDAAADISYDWMLNGWAHKAEHNDSHFLYKDGKWLSPVWWYE